MVDIDLLRTALQAHYAFSLEGDWTKLTGGYECEVWRAGAYVVRVCPEWRSDAELEWVYGHVAALAKQIPQVVAPMPTIENRYFVRHQDQLVAVFPYIEGTPLDRNNPAHIRQSAELLAQIHTASVSLVDNPNRPPSHPSAPTEIPLQDDPKTIQDDYLDDWYNGFVQRPDPVMGLLHGDYYRANILCDGDEIVGVIDWDGLHYGERIREIAWATWEQCQTDTGDHLDTLKAARFLASYRRLSGQESTAIVPLIRWHLRYEIRRSLAMEEAGKDWDNDYRQQEIRAFKNLRKLILSIF